VLQQLPEAPGRVQVVYRRAGDCNLLVEYGPLVLDLRLRFRVHALMRWLEQSKLPGIVDLTPGVRSLQIHFDPHALSSQLLLSALESAERELASIDDVEVPTRTCTCRCRGRSANAAGDSKVHDFGPARCAVVPEQHRVHSPHQWFGFRGRRASHRVRRQLLGARLGDVYLARRSRRPSIRGTGW